MYRIFAFTFAVICLAFSATTARSQGNLDDIRKGLEGRAQDEYRLFFKEPQTPLEYWGAVTFEIDLGKFDLAYYHLDKLLKLKDKDAVDTELLKIENEQRMAPFLKLKDIRTWFRKSEYKEADELNKEANANVVTLIDRITAAVEKKYRDSGFLNKMIYQLSAPSVEERAFAFDQLNKARWRASPYLVDHLKRTVGKTEHLRIAQVMYRLNEEILPPLLEVFKAADFGDAKDPENSEVRITLMNLFQARNEKSILPYLWHMSKAEMYPSYVRDHALKVLSEMRKQDPRSLPEAHVILAEFADQCYRHRYPFPFTKRSIGEKDADLRAKVPFWSWDGKQLARVYTELPLTDAEFLFGVRYARDSLDLAPNYKPAQKTLLALLLEREFKDKLKTFLGESTNPLIPDFVPPKDIMPDGLHKLLATIDADFLLESLEVAMNDKNVSVILPLIRIIGERGEVRAMIHSPTGKTRGLPRALYFPDQRVQLAAVRAILLMPVETPALLKSRILHILGRSLATTVLPEARVEGALPKALLLNVPETEKALARKAIKDVGWEPHLVTSAREAFDLLHKTADVDFVMIHPGTNRAQLPYLLSQLRSDADAGLVPVILLVKVDDQPNYVSFTHRSRNIYQMTPGLLQPETTKELKTALDRILRLSHAPDFVVTLPPSRRNTYYDDLEKATGLVYDAPERFPYSAEAMYYLASMSQGVIKGYKLDSLKPILMEASRTKDKAIPALQALATLSGQDVQMRLADEVILSKDVEARKVAAILLNRHIKEFSLALPPVQKEQLAAIVQQPQQDPILRTQMSLLLGHLRGNRASTGLQLKTFSP